MKVTFLISKTKEKEKLLNIHSEYQWFIDNDFPIILPNFYTKLYEQNKKNKVQFAKDMSRNLDKIYNQRFYQRNLKQIKTNWQRVEQKIFNILNNFNLKIKNKYFCYISLYGPQGQFKYPNLINLRVNNTKDIKEANETIAHELIHLLIYNKVKKINLNYKQIEGLVDLFFTETDLKIFFLDYQMQNIAEHNKNLFRKIVSNL